MKNHVAAVGHFDGVHLGHQRIISEVISCASGHGSESLVLALEPHPREVLHETAPRGRLTSLSEKRERVLSLGTDSFIVLEFTRRMASLKAQQFVKDVIMDRFGVTSLVMGHDQRLGAGRTGDAERLREWGRGCGLEVISVGAVSVAADNGTPVTVSSTAIREALSAGSVEWAAALLGRRYSFTGTVVRGEGRGGPEVGYPTANLVPAAPEKLLPADGVYAVCVTFDGRSLPGVLNLGRRPTFGGGPTRAEVHVTGFSGELYEASLDVSFVARLREERRFRDPRELRDQIAQDVRAALQIVR